MDPTGIISRLTDIKTDSTGIILTLTGIKSAGTGIKRNNTARRFQQFINIHINAKKAGDFTGFSLISRDYLRDLIDASMKSLNNGCGRVGLDVNSGWNWDARNHG